MLFSLFLCFLSILLHIFIDFEAYRTRDKLKIDVGRNSVNAIGSENQIQRLQMNFTKTYIIIASWVGKVVVPAIDFIFTTIFLGIGILSLVVGEESVCEQSVNI